MVSVELVYKVRGTFTSHNFSLINHEDCSNLVQQLQEVALNHEHYLEAGSVKELEQQLELFFSLYQRWLELVKHLTDRDTQITDGLVDRYKVLFDKRDSSPFSWLLDLIDPIKPNIPE